MRRGAVAAGTLPTAMFDSGRPATIVIVGTDILLYFMKIDRFEKVSREVMILALNDEGAIEVLGRIDLDVADSESAALTGNSWSGKSTLLHLAKGLDRVGSGTVLMDGSDLGKFSGAERARYRRTRVVLCFSSSTLFFRSTSLRTCPFMQSWRGVTIAAGNIPWSRL